MNNKILLLIFALMHFCSVSGQNKNVAWIESKFVDNIVYDRKADGKYLFPVEGFQMENGKLFILAYNGEITPLKYKKTATDYEIENFGSYISEFSWSENLESLYRKAVFTFRYDNEDICLTIKTAKGTEKRRYVCDLGGSRFATILEAKGWLLDMLVPNIFENE